MGWRSEYKSKAQSAYGGYCSLCKSNNVTPVPYYQFTDYYVELNTKQIFKKLHQ